MKYSFRKRLNSIGFAFAGIKTMLVNEPNARIHVFAMILIVGMGFLFQITAYEWLAICLSIALVFSLEIVNTSIESLADFVSPGKHDEIRKVKDLAAAAVLFAASIAFVVAIVIFLPKILLLLTT